MGIVSFTDKDGQKHFADAGSKAYEQHLKDQAAAAEPDQGDEGPSEPEISTVDGAVETILAPLAEDVELAQKTPRPSRKPKAPDA